MFETLCRLGISTGLVLLLTCLCGMLPHYLKPVLPCPSVRDSKCRHRNQIIHCHLHYGYLFLGFFISYGITFTLRQVHCNMSLRMAIHLSTSFLNVVHLFYSNQIIYLLRLCSQIFFTFSS